MKAGFWETDGFLGRVVIPAMLLAMIAIDAPARAKANVIGSTVFFSELRIAPGLPYIDRLPDVSSGPRPEAEAGPPPSSL